MGLFKQNTEVGANYVLHFHNPIYGSPPNPLVAVSSLVLQPVWIISSERRSPCVAAPIKSDPSVDQN